MTPAILALSLLLAQAPDAPLAVPEAPVRLQQGQPAPFPGILDTEDSFTKAEQRRLAAEAKVKVYEATPPVPVAAVVAVVAAVVAGATGAVVTWAVMRPRQ
jgi:hypothetical protein